MKITKIPFGSALLILLMSSCTKNCDETYDETYIDVISVISCSPDLLEFVTPVVTITDESGHEESKELSASEFEASEKGGSIEINVTVNDKTASASTTTVNNIAKFAKHYNERTQVSGNITVSYKIKDNIRLDKESYVFFHNVGYESKTMRDGFSFTLEGTYFKPFAYEVAKEDVMDYLEKLKSEADETSFSISAPSK